MYELIKNHELVLTPEHAKEITGVKLTVEDLKNSTIIMLIKTMESSNRRIDIQKDIIISLSDRLEIYEPKHQSRQVNLRSNPDSSRTYLRIV